MRERDTRAAIVLAGGASSRVGADKLRALVDGRPLLDRALVAVDEVAATIVVVVPPQAETPPLPELAARVLVARDADRHQGPLAGLAAGLAALAVDAPGVDLAILVGGDMPLLVPAVLARQLDALAADPALGALTLEAEPLAPLPMAVRPSLVAPAAAAVLADGRRALRAVLRLVPAGVLPATSWRALDPTGTTLRDVDKPEDVPPVR